MQNRIGARWTFVPYRGGSQAMQDLLGGQIDLYCTTPGTSLAIVRSGQVNAYAITGKSRLAAAPDIPTVDEAGLPGLHVLAWHGLWAPKGTPKEVVVRLNAAVKAALADRAVGNRLADLGLSVAPRDEQTPEALGAFQRAEIGKWWPIIKAANIKPN
jgi:tripartite-type tricarboxylate transporter receptor subunit TctC